MKSKVVKSFTYKGLGFPVELQKVKMLMIDGEWHPKIDVRKIADVVIESLVSQKERFTGNQVKFIRTYFSMSLREFAENVVKESHTAVNKWEKSGNHVTNMDINIEKMLRLYISDVIYVKNRNQKVKFYEKYKELKNLSSSSTVVNHLKIIITPLMA
ncbi:MAG: hypothetical protein JSS53_07525 [Proteobacteria bacterium]|nr:hypothetical protein [Pseudomonadota bacterium]